MKDVIMMGKKKKNERSLPIAIDNFHSFFSYYVFFLLKRHSCVNYFSSLIYRVLVLIFWCKKFAFA